MANYNKSFNFRNGVQVDNDNLVVDTLGKVGIGTTVPLEFLDIRGNATITGFATASSLYTIDSRVSGVLTATTFTDGKITINSGIITAASGVVTFYGDGTGLVNIPTSQWVDTDVGLGYTSIYAAGSVGIATTDPRYTLQIGGNNNVSNFVAGVGINSTGDILATGIITASTVRAALAATFLTGTIDNARLASNINVSGIVTASSFVGSFTGTATAAQSLTGSPSITVTNISSGIVTASNATVTGNAAIGGFASIGSTLTVSGNTNVSGILTATNIKSGLSTVGVATVHDTFHVGTSGTFFAITSAGRIGIGSAAPTSDLLVRKEGASLVEVISDSTQARVSIGNSVGVGNSTGVIRFGNSAKTFDVINRDTGNLNMILHGGGSGIGTGRFDWVYGQTNGELMSLTYDGRLGIGKTNPDTNLHVVGTSTVTGNSWFGNDVKIVGNLTAGSFSLPSIYLGNVFTNTGISTFNNINSLGNLTLTGASSSIGIDTTSPIVGLDVRNDTALLQKIGIGTDSVGGDNVCFILGSIAIPPEGYIGIGTTAAIDLTPNPEFGQIQLYTRTIDMNNSLLNIKNDGAIGFNTYISRSIFDYGRVGGATTNPYMILPNVTTSVRAGLAQTVEGAIIYNSTTKKHQGYGSTDGGLTFNWNDLY